MANKAQTSVGVKDFSATMTGNPVRLIAEDPSRSALLLMNCSANDQFLYFAPIGNNNTTPTITAGAAGVFCLSAASGAGKQGGSYEPDGGFIPINEVWVKGTNTDVCVCVASAVP